MADTKTLREALEMARDALYHSSKATWVDGRIIRRVCCGSEEITQSHKESCYVWAAYGEAVNALAAQAQAEKSVIERHGDRLARIYIAEQAQAEPVRQPLTDEHIADLFEKAGGDLIPARSGAFRAGVKLTERAHGITGEPTAAAPKGGAS